jgi:hypothetical protein
VPPSRRTFLGFSFADAVTWSAGSPTPPNLEVFLILSAVKGVDDFVAITRDLHSLGAGYLRANFDNPLQRAVGISLLGGSVPAANFVEQISFSVGGRLVPPESELTWALRGSNPHLKFSIPPRTVM